MSYTKLKNDPIARIRQKWIEQGWEDGALGLAGIMSVSRANQILLNRADVILRPLGLNFSRYEVLMMLFFAEKGEYTMGELGQMLQVHPASANNSVSRLVEQGFAQRKQAKADGRVMLISILPAGAAAFEKATEEMRVLFSGRDANRPEAEVLVNLLTILRYRSGDFEEAPDQVKLSRI